MSRRTSVIYATSVRYKRNILLASFTLVSLCALASLLFLAYAYIPEGDSKAFILLILGVLGSVVATAAGAILSVLFEHPTIFLKFDAIKDAVARREISSAIEFARAANEFFVTNLRYTYLSVDHSCMKLLAHPIQCSSEEMLHRLSHEDLQRIEQRARDTQEVFREADVEIKGRRQRCYVTPIHFGEDYLGFWLIATGHRLWKPFWAFLEDIEDYLLDDQLIHAISTERMIVQRQYYLDIDVLSDKITLRQYGSLEEYLDAMVEITAAACNARGVICETVYSQDRVAHFREPLSATEETRLLEGLETLRSLESRVVPLSLGQWSIYVFVLPIMIEKLRGYLFIVDDSRSNLEYRMQMLQDIENLKIDNDVMNLVHHLGLQPVQDLLPERPI